jgi:phosphate transport system substrate-binding protein
VVKKLTTISMVAAVLMTGILAGCGANQTSTQTTAQSSTTQTTDKGGASGPVVAVGSTALQPLAEQAAQMYMQDHSGSNVQIQGGGSGTGLSQVAQGGATIGDSDIFAEEKSGIPANQLVDHKVAIVAMGAVVNKENKVDNLTKQQLIDVFTGKVSNWKQVGGADMKITIVNRPASSGTRATFYTFALDKHKEAQGITEDSSGTVRKIVSQTPGAISYLALSYIDSSIKALKLDGVEPTAANVETNKYPVWSYEHMYTKGEPQGSAKDYIDYVLSDKIQKETVAKAGYIPVTEMKVERDAQGQVKNK